MHFVKFHPVGSFLFTLQRQNKVCTPGDEAIMKIHKKLFTGIPINFTFFCYISKTTKNLKLNFGFANRKLWAFIWYQKCTTFDWALGDKNVIGLRSFKCVCLWRKKCCDIMCGINSWYVWFETRLNWAIHSVFCHQVQIHLFVNPSLVYKLPYSFKYRSCPYNRPSTSFSV